MSFKLSQEILKQLEEEPTKPFQLKPSDSLYERGFKDGYNEGLLAVTVVEPSQPADKP